MLEEKVIFEIDTKGNTKVTVKGVKGRGCKALTADFEKGLGKTISDVDTKEIYEQQPVQQAPYVPRQAPTFTSAPLQAAQFQPLSAPQMPSLMAAMSPLQDQNGLLAALQRQLG